MLNRGQRVGSEQDVNPSFDPVLAETKAKGPDWRWPLIVIGYGCGWYIFFLCALLYFPNCLKWTFLTFRIRKKWIVKNKCVCHTALGSGGAIMEMRYALRYCTPKRAWVWVGARWKTCSLLSTIENRGFGSNFKTEKLGNGLWRV